MNREIDRLINESIRLQFKLYETTKKIEAINDREQPVVPPPVVPDPPVEPVPEPEPDTPNGDGLMPDVLLEPRLWIWREGSSANDFNVREAIVVATRGLAGAATVRIICMNGDPIVDVKNMVNRTIQAKKEGCVAVCIDLESYFIRKGQKHAEEVDRQVSSILPLLWAPKMFNDHLVKHWGFKDYDQGAKWLGDHGDGQIAWGYSRPNASSWIEFYNKTRRMGNKDLYIPLGDFASRTSAGARTRPFGPEVPNDFKAHGMSIGVFMPDSGTWTDIVRRTAVWNKAVEVYG
jgi:hypothetical protein